MPRRGLPGQARPVRVREGDRRVERRTGRHRLLVEDHPVRVVHRRRGRVLVGRPRPDEEHRSGDLLRGRTRSPPRP